MLVSLTVGKVDAGVAVLLTEDKRLIEFPSILLPHDISCGSIVDVNVARNHGAEAQATKAFRTLQQEILTTFGSESPSAPTLRCRNATQTSVVLEWDPISLATAELRSLTLFRNGNKAGAIPRPLDMTTSKISGLAVDTEYSFHLVLRTSAGTYSSEKLVVRTHKMTDLTGITVTPGIMAQPLRDDLEKTLDRMGAKFIETLRIDTTHFVCTEGRGQPWERAVESNIPVVLPDWVKGCEREGRLVGVRGYYLNADPKQRQVGPGVALQRGDSTQSVQQRPRSPTRLDPPRTEITPPTPERGDKADKDPEHDVSEESEDEAPSALSGKPVSPPEQSIEVEAQGEAEDREAEKTKAEDEDEEEEEEEEEEDDDQDAEFTKAGTIVQDSVVPSAPAASATVSAGETVRTSVETESGSEEQSSEAQDKMDDVPL